MQNFSPDLKSGKSKIITYQLITDFQQLPKLLMLNKIFLKDE